MRKNTYIGITRQPGGLGTARFDDDGRAPYRQGD